MNKKAKLIKIGGLYCFRNHTIYVFTDVEWAKNTYQDTAWGPLSYSITKVYTMGPTNRGYAYPLQPGTVFMVVEQNGIAQYKIIAGDIMGWINIEPNSSIISTI